MNWEEWVRENSHKLELIDPHGYKLNFVFDVLANIDGITPDNTFVHYPINNGNQYVNFAIIDKQNKYNLPIELDAHQTVKRDYENFNDFLNRQNALMHEFGILLRFSNLQAKKTPYDCINKIKEILNLQYEQKITDEVKNRESQANIEAYKEQLEMFSKQLGSVKNELIQLQIEKADEEKMRLEAEYERDKEVEKNKNVSEDIKNLTEAIEKIGVPVSRPEKKKDNFFYYLSFILLAIVICIYLIFFKKDNPNTSEAPVKTVLSQSTKGKPYKSAQVTYGNAISPWHVDNHIGEEVQICGKIVEIKKFSKGLYLNFEKKYPNAPLAAVIWKSSTGLFKKAPGFLGTKICIAGKVSEYKSKPQVILKSMNQIL